MAVDPSINLSQPQAAIVFAAALPLLPLLLLQAG
jgi:hypothetical protein